MGLILYLNSSRTHLANQPASLVLLNRLADRAGDMPQNITLLAKAAAVVIAGCGGDAVATVIAAAAAAAGMRRGYSHLVGTVLLPG